MIPLEVLRQNVTAAKDFKPMTPAEAEALRTRVANVAADGRFELY